MLGDFLDLDRCPQCKTANPTLEYCYERVNENKEPSGIFKCSKCTNSVFIEHFFHHDAIEINIYPSMISHVDENIPQSAARYLKQAIETLGSPDASIMTSASALDMMLQEHDLNAGTLHERINKAAEQHLITEDMANWGHHVRLEANDSRHPETEKTASTQEDAEQSLEFVLALAEILFVLPARVTRGLAQTQTQE